MKTKIAAIAIVALASLAGCQSLKPEAATVEAWWNQPSTQEGVKIAESAALQAGLSVAEDALAHGGNVDAERDAFVGVGAALRPLELTPSAQDPLAVAQAVASVVQNPATAKKVAAAVIDSAQAATDKGADPSGALEGAVRGLEAASAK